MAKKNVGLAKTYGTRYGKNIRQRVGILEQEARRHHKCPYCNYIRVKRVSAGVWECEKCKSKFTGKAYSAQKKILNPYALQSEDVQVYKGDMEAK